jgi:hypothetical protein
MIGRIVKTMGPGMTSRILNVLGECGAALDLLLCVINVLSSGHAYRQAQELGMCYCRICLYRCAAATGGGGAARRVYVAACVFVLHSMRVAGAVC